MMMVVNNKCRNGVNANGKSIPVKFSKSGNSNKRKAGVILECLKEKRQRMDRNFKEQYSSILRTLMGHPHGFAFNQPIDPVKLNIPDYFSIITEPMDLGKIKCKVEDNIYLDAEEFADDVRLTFSNAMLFNPPGNYFYNFAKELNDFFSRRWKLLKTKLNLINDGTSLELERAIKVSLDVTDGKVKAARTALSGRRHASGTVHKDGGNQRACIAANRNQQLDSPAVECATRGSLICQCSVRRCSVKPSSSDFSSERLSHRDHSGDSKPGCGVKYPSTSHTRGLKLDSFGHECVPYEDNFPQRFSSLATTAAIDEEKERNTTEDRTSVAASQKRVDIELKLKTQRERERKAARIALEKMGKTVDIDENRNVMDDFEAIIGGINSGNLRDPLEQLGLYIKDDYMEEDEKAILQGEKGEILS